MNVNQEVENIMNITINSFITLDIQNLDLKSEVVHLPQSKIK